MAIWGKILAEPFYRLIKLSGHPIAVFATLQVVWLTMTLMWVIWFVGSFQEISKLARITGSSYFDTHSSSMVLVIGCILLGMIFLGTLLLFIISQRQRHLMVQQKSFVSSVTHELRSPLASLQLTFETMKSRKLDSNTTGTMLNMAAEDIERLTRLVDHILISSRLDKGISGFSEEAQSLNFYELIQLTISQAQWLDPSLKNRIEVICPPELEINAPKPSVCLILSNLLENAIKYSPKSSEIKIMVTQKDDGVTLAVKDQGFGLGGSDKKRIFRMFHRATVTQKKAIPGTGLGLFIVKSLTKSLGGDVWAESPGKDKGTTFYVSFPTGSEHNYS